ncbi:MAG: hypothetical protein ABIY51_09205 [Ferruginibacter sp.]
MTSRTTTNNRMRIYHRYLGFFLAGIMAVYAISGITLIFRDTSFLKQEMIIEKKLAPNLPIAELGKQIVIRDLKADSEDADQINFKNGNYNKTTGAVKYKVTALPVMIEKLTQLHKASTKEPLFFLNVFFALSLLFFVVSSFWMFLPQTSIFKKGLYFSAAGIVLTLVLIYLK